MSKVLDVLLGGEQPVSVMQTGPVRTERRDGLLGAVSDPLRYAPGPVGAVAEAANAYAEGGMEGLAKSGADVALSLFGAKTGPMMRRIAAGQNAKEVPKAIRKRMLEAEEFGVPGQQYDRDVWLGMEGKARWEISDADAALTRPIGNIKNFDKLGNVLVHPELYKQYPDLANWRVQPMKLDGANNKSYGAADAKNKVIYVNPTIPIKDQLSTIVHEAQHGVQKIEGFASGTGNVQSQHLAVNAMANYHDTQDPAAKRLLRAQFKELGFDPDKDSIKKLSQLLYQKKSGEVEARTVQARMEKAKQLAPDETLDEPFTAEMGRDKYTPILWQDTWNQMFGTRELPPLVDLKSGKLIPIRD